MIPTQHMLQFAKLAFRDELYLIDSLLLTQTSTRNIRFYSRMNIIPVYA